MTEQPKRPICRHCRFYFITWDQGVPHGCRLYQIKSQQIPSVVVKQASGQECAGFESKDKKELFK